MSTCIQICVLSIIIPLILSISTNDETIHSIKIYPFMQISMTISITTIPSTPDTIFSIDQFLSISITSPNTLQLQIQSNTINQHPISANIPYTLNITLNPSNPHYSLQYPSSNIPQQTYPFVLHSSPYQYTISHPLTINNKSAQISNLLITTHESPSNGYISSSSSSYSSAITNNRIFANIPNNSSISTTTDPDDDYESIFGPNVSREEEIIYAILIIVAVVCMVTIVAYGTVRRCTKRNRRKAMHNSNMNKRSYQKVHKHSRGASASNVNYVDETPGNHDVQDIQLPLKQIREFNESPQPQKPVEQERNEGEVDKDIRVKSIDVGITTPGGDMKNDNNNNNNDDDDDDGEDNNNRLQVVVTNVADRDDSISAMSI